MPEETRRTWSKTSEKSRRSPTASWPPRLCSPRSVRSLHPYRSGRRLDPRISDATGVAENRLIALLTALKSLGLIAEAGGRLANAPATSRYLVAGATGDFRDYIRFVNGEFGYESFRHLGPALRGERIFADKGYLKASSMKPGLAAKGTAPPSMPARSARRGFSPNGSISTDIGGCWTPAAAGATQHSRLCAANPRLSETILDFPQTVDFGQAIRARGGSRRWDRPPCRQRHYGRLARGT